MRADLPFIAIASVIFVAGVAALVLARLRTRHPLLLCLGIFAVLYAVRLFLQNDLIRTATGVSAVQAGNSLLFLTYIIPIPYALFTRQLLGPGWKNSLSVWFWVQVAFAVLAIPIALLAHQSRWTDRANFLFIVGGTLLALLHVVLRRDSPASPATSLKWPLIIFGLFVLLTNLGFKPAGTDVEPFGFSILLTGLAYTASRRAVARERKLTEVEGELATARRIQRSILPRTTPDFPTLHIAAKYVPMTAVAGDFYDFLQTGDDWLTILVADVSGHGVPAALVASMLKICFAAQREKAHDPAQVLSGFNAMLRDVLDGQYVTAACVAIDLAAQTLTYAGAGHPPSLLLRSRSADVLELAQNGLFIGPFPRATYANISVPFERGDKLLLYTDGIIEATVSDGEQFGRERLSRLLLDAQTMAPEDFLDRLFTHIATPAQEDDLTVVLATRD